MSIHNLPQTTRDCLPYIHAMEGNGNDACSPKGKSVVLCQPGFDIALKTTRTSATWTSKGNPAGPGRQKGQVIAQGC